MTRGRGVVLVVIVSLAFATDSFAGAPAFSIAQGPVTLLSTSELTVQANAQIPTSCTRSSSSPVVAGFKVGDQVTINCVQGVLVSIAKGLSKPPLGPVIPIRGLPQFHAGVPIPGPNPTAGQCVAAWNAGAPLVAREAIGAQSPLAAYVGTESVSRGSSPGGPACSIYFALPGVRTAWVTGVWKDGAARTWQGFTEDGDMGPTRGILSLAIIKEIAATSPEASHWFWVSQHGTISRAR